MAFEKINYVPGDVLTADQVNAMQDGIKNNEGNIESHITTTNNPHNVTKEQVGLGNVPNVATDDQTPTFSTASTLENITSGEKLSSIFGKIAKAISDLISHIGNKSNPHGVTATQVGARPNTWTPTASDVGAVPTSRTVNGKALSANITLSASDVGAAASSHGNHVPTKQTADNATFLRNDNTWQKVTPANIGAAAASHGTHVSYGTSAKALGTSSAGSASTVSRSDHVHALPALTSCTGTLTVAKGGTGATSAANARKNLELENFKVINVTNSSGTNLLSCVKQVYNASAIDTNVLSLVKDGSASRSLILGCRYTGNYAYYIGLGVFGLYIYECSSGTWYEKFVANA